MSVTRFRQLVGDAKYGKNDKKWFPKWVQRYAATAPTKRGALIFAGNTAAGGWETTCV